ncbi:TPA: hypothetical protein JBD01_04400 [Legionella pneumophila subsp. pneumophila]|nr:hypothetical protein [Legionella pneumophila subsp. pneumophila]HCJ4211008.1 hypothetical protein [Legionella pneumophila]
MINHNLSSKPYEHSYLRLNDNRRKMIDEINKVIDELFNNNVRFLRDRLEEKTDSDAKWLSYVVKLFGTPEETLEFNKRFIDYCFQNNHKELLTEDVIFRFETN